MIWRCFICYILVALTLKLLLSHINTMHSRSPDFRFVCGIDGCPSEYRVYNSFYYDVKRTHAHHLLQVEAAEEEGPTRHGLPGAGERTASNDQTNVSPVAEAEGSSIAIPASLFQEDGEGRMNVDLSKHATAFLLQARETHRLTQRAVNQMIERALQEDFPKMKQLTGGWMFYKATVPLQEKMSTTPLPPDAAEFNKMPKASCKTCNSTMPLQMLALHVQECELDKFKFEPEDASEQEPWNVEKFDNATDSDGVEVVEDQSGVFVEIASP
ncbi:uncharacterized protein LOC115580373 [Sparus aurata]|uniref:uncharacterized protein LOC115580373 n=1 Tax=Sparus aurata TaxID=8175 RepID=UPI0011C134B7|nr:uncharacterized protein LOC115580373 [Sparus aurata]